MVRHRFTSEEIRAIRRALLAWYDANKRKLPWRDWHDTDPNIVAYRVLVSELMLQQTQVATVIRYYETWMQQWPTVQSLAEASEDVRELELQCFIGVINLPISLGCSQMLGWYSHRSQQTAPRSVFTLGLGYYNRARNLYKSAQLIVNEYNGQFPTDVDLMIDRLPGVGRYTAGAVTSIAFNQPNPILDGNVIRVASRMRCIGGDLKKRATTDHLWSLAADLVCLERAGDFNQSLMELGATVCTPQKPKCHECPVQQYCLAYQQQHETTKNPVDIEDCASDCNFCLKPNEIDSKRPLVEQYPRKKTKTKQRQETALVLIMYRLTPKLEFLMMKQKQPGLLSGLWSFLEMTASSDLDEMNERKRKAFVIEEVQNRFMFNQTLHIENIKLAGQCRHLFSHIDKHYIIYYALSHQNDISLGAQFQWLSEEQVQTSATSTAMKKVFNVALPEIKLKNSTGKKNGTLHGYFKKQKS